MSDDIRVATQFDRAARERRPSMSERKRLTEYAACAG
jgi:hypothetical protein